MSFFRPRFHFRSATRDAETDLLRRKRLSSAVQFEVSGITKELEGVVVRFKAAQDVAASLCGTDLSDAAERDTRDISDLDAAEQSLVGAQQRIQQLTRQREELLELEMQLEPIFRLGQKE
jgi:hypothetical protein